MVDSAIPGLVWSIILYVYGRAALEDIKVDLQERTQRWKRVEQLCGFNIVINPGAPYLNSLLRDFSSGSAVFSSSKNSSSIKGVFFYVMNA